MRYIFSVIILLILVSSCKKKEGEGGNGGIKGKVFTKRYTIDYSTYITTYAAKDEDVYIQYGEEVGVSDKTTTDYNGEFEFKYLYPGKYTIFVYSEDTTMNDLSGKIVVKQIIQISKDEIKDIDLIRSDNN